MHDLAEGIIPQTVQLVLSRYSKTIPSFTKNFINFRLNSFNFGFAERKNRPVANFTEDMLSKPGEFRLKQTSTQNFLLLRSFPFLFGDKISEDCQLMAMIGHLINLTRILLSPIISEDMLMWLEEHIRLYSDLFYAHFKKRINKLHHLQHYPEYIRRCGSPKQSNCLPFEQKNKPMKNQAGTCRNFKNINKSLAVRQTHTTIIDIMDNPFHDKFSIKAGKRQLAENTLSSIYLPIGTKTVSCPKNVKFNGIEFRKNLVICLKNNNNNPFPSYGIIREIVDNAGEVYFLVRTCFNLGIDEFLEAYEVEITEKDEFVHMRDIFQQTTFSLWKPYYSSKKYISRRVYNKDY